MVAGVWHNHVYGQKTTTHNMRGKASLEACGQRAKLCMSTTGEHK